MGKRIAKCFAEAERLGGLVARIRLATRVQIYSGEATDVEDTPEAIERVERALELMRGEFAGPASSIHTMAGGAASSVRAYTPPSSPPPEILSAPAGDQRTQSLRRNLALYADLLAQRGSYVSNPGETMRRVTETSSAALGVSRVSVWLCDERRQKITCSNLFDRAGVRHSAGMELTSKDFPAYFLALRTERTIAAHDAHQDQRTAAFTPSYLKPLGITSLLDIPIWVNGRMVGVLCHEHTGPKRVWDHDEETVAYLLSSLVALSLEWSTPSSP
jgi:hypothetical protein